MRYAARTVGVRCRYAYVYCVTGLIHFLALANARRGLVCRVTVEALRAAMPILVDTGIVQQTFVAGAGTDDTLSILAKFIGLALRVTFAAV